MTISQMSLYGVGGLLVVYLLVRVLLSNRRRNTRAAKSDRRGTGGDGDTLEGVERRRQNERRAGE